MHLVHSIARAQPQDVFDGPRRPPPVIDDPPTDAPRPDDQDPGVGRGDELTEDVTHGSLAPPTPPPPRSRDAAVASTLVLIGVMIAVCLVAALFLKRYRGGVFGGGAGPEDDLTLMESLRQLRDRGEMSHDEYERTRRRLVERLRERTPGSETPRTPKANDVPTDGPGGPSETCGRFSDHRRGRDPGPPTDPPR
ncbi:MAG: hypothetical protein HRU70_02930 [Phycisphaeraceae bacterium]|nr:MAG: hypothetical protein HRU70_02930 [Phycisphaeraceae bacterium]